MLTYLYPYGTYAGTAGGAGVAAALQAIDQVTGGFSALEVDHPLRIAKLLEVLEDNKDL